MNKNNIILVISILAIMISSVAISMNLAKTEDTPAIKIDDSSVNETEELMKATFENEKNLVEIEKLKAETERAWAEVDKINQDKADKDAQKAILDDCLNKENIRYEEVWNNYLNADAPLLVDFSYWYEMWEKNEKMNDEEIAKCYQLYSIE
jgi:hypothetical protein